MKVNARREVVIPEGATEVYQIFCTQTQSYSSILDDGGTYNVLMGIEIDKAHRDDPCLGEHQVIEVVLP